jgi:glycosyltransferase involved in cell wall biosynthesis
VKLAHICVAGSQPLLARTGGTVQHRNGISCPQPSGERGRHPERSGRWRLFYVGQLIPLKNPDLLLHALAEVRTSVDIELRLVYHNARLEADLRQLSERLGLTGRVTFVGGCGPEEVLAKCAMADALVLPSATEALPSVVTEALMAARPVLTSAVDGVPEQVAEATTVRSRQVVEEFSANRMVDRHVELYEGLLRSRRGRRASP